MTGHLDPSGMDPAELERLGLGAAALAYQRLGYAVLALGAGSKRPHHLFASEHGPAGVCWATTGPAMVEYVWARDKLAGVGVATGSPSRLLVIDLDVKGGANGRVELGKFMLEHQLAVPMAVQVTTPSGGWHIWLRLPLGASVPSRTGILPGVDIKADGGYVAAAPSRVWQESLDGGRVLLPYRMAGCPCQLPEAPAWLLDWIERTPGTGSGSGGGDAGPLPDLDELAGSGIPAGQRNTMIHRLACSLYRRCGPTPAGTAAVRAALAPVLAVTDMRGLGEAELRRALDSARRFVAGQEQREAQAWQAR